MFKYFIALILTIIAVYSMDSHSATLTKQLPDGQYITMTSDARYGGAITSLKFRGKDFVYTGAHGSSLMTAMTFDGFGECYNPTQGGSRSDATYFGGVEESSKTLSTYMNGNTIYTGTLMGFWMPPGTPHPYNCGQSLTQKSAVNTTITSTVLLQSNYTFGYDDFMNVMTNDVTINIAEDHTKAGFEPSTIYTPDDLNVGWLINLTTGVLTPATAKAEQASEMIIATPNNQYAVGVMSRTNTLRYTFFTSATAPWWSKIGVYYRTLSPVKARSAYKFQVQYIFGTLDEVVTTMMAIKASPKDI